MNTENPHTSPRSEVSTNEYEQGINAYATFWQRFAASLIDGIITGIMASIAGGLLGFCIGFAGGGTEAAGSAGYFIGIIIGWLYGALLESSVKQATWGKQMMKIKVADLHGNRISFGKASGRHFAKIISALIILIGYLMMLWTEKKQTLHDMISGCLVSQNRG